MYIETNVIILFSSILISFVLVIADFTLRKTSKKLEEKKFELELQKQLNELPYTPHLDDGQYNDGVITGFELGAEWARRDVKRK